MKTNSKIFLINLLLIFCSKLNSDIVQIENDVKNPTQLDYVAQEVQTYNQNSSDTYTKDVAIEQNAIKYGEKIILTQAENKAPLNVRCFIFIIDNMTQRLIWTANNKDQTSIIKVSAIIEADLPYKKIGNFYIQSIPDKENLSSDKAFQPLDKMREENPFFIEKSKIESEFDHTTTIKTGPKETI